MYCSQWFKKTPQTRMTADEGLSLKMRNCPLSFDSEQIAMKDSFLFYLADNANQYTLIYFNVTLK